VRRGLWVAEEYCSTPARGLALVLPPGAGTGALPRVGVKRALAAEITAAGREALASGARLGSRQRAALEALAEGPRLASAAMKPATLRSLEARGLVTLDRVELRRRPDLVAVGARCGEPAALTRAQEEALAEVLRAMDGDEGRLLLHGVTGSGKTAVYLRAVAGALDR